MLHVGFTLGASRAAFHKWTGLVDMQCEVTPDASSVKQASGRVNVFVMNCFLFCVGENIRPENLPNKFFAKVFPLLSVSVVLTISGNMLMKGQNSSH